MEEIQKLWVQRGSWAQGLFVVKSGMHRSQRPRSPG